MSKKSDNQLEKEFQRDLIKLLDPLPHLKVVRFVPHPIFGTQGIPDILICYKGLFIALELKVKKREPTALQRDTLEEFALAGGFAICAWDEAITDIAETLSQDVELSDLEKRLFQCHSILWTPESFSRSTLTSKFWLAKPNRK